jgi:RNA polymerase sigma factor (sigma-70 family)
MTPFSFEDKIKIINSEIDKKRERWRFNFIHDVDYDDVRQIILIHVNKKWGQWDQERPLEPWLSKVISHQINNMIRNTFGKLAPPCYNCPFNTGGDACLFCSSGVKSHECKPFAKWEKTKKGGYNIIMASSIDSDDFSEKNEPSGQISQTELIFEEFHRKIKPLLSDRCQEVYQMLYVEGKTDDDVAKKFGFVTNEVNRKPGYRQIANMKREIISVAKKHLPEFGLFD